MIMCFGAYLAQAQRGSNITSKDTIEIKSEISLINKISKETNRKSTYVVYNNKNYTTDGLSIKNYNENPNNYVAYIIYNNYDNGERKVSKIIIKPKK